jgi:hypothetical protein
MRSVTSTPARQSLGHRTSPNIYRPINKEEPQSLNPPEIRNFASLKASQAASQGDLKIVNSARIWRLGIARIATLAQCAFKIFAQGGVASPLLLLDGHFGGYQFVCSQRHVRACLLVLGVLLRSLAPRSPARPYAISYAPTMAP